MAKDRHVTLNITNEWGPAVADLLSVYDRFIPTGYRIMPDQMGQPEPETQLAIAKRQQEAFRRRLP